MEQTNLVVNHRVSDLEARIDVLETQLHWSDIVQTELVMALLKLYLQDDEEHVSH